MAHALKEAGGDTWHPVTGAKRHRESHRGHLRRLTENCVLANDNLSTSVTISTPTRAGHLLPSRFRVNRVPHLNQTSSIYRLNLNNYLPASYIQPLLWLKYTKNYGSLRSPETVSTLRMVSVPRVSLSQGVSLQCTENFSSINTCEQLLRERERERQKGAEGGTEGEGPGREGARGRKREGYIYIQGRLESNWKHACHAWYINNYFCRSVCLNYSQNFQDFGKFKSCKCVNGANTLQAQIRELFQSRSHGSEAHGMCQVKTFT